MVFHHPHVLKPLGYRSYHSGKWHVDPIYAKVTSEAGFDRSYWRENANQNFKAEGHTEDDHPLPPAKPGTDYYATTAIADHMIKYLQEHAQAHAGKPFFAYVAYLSPHFPLHAPAEDIARYKGKYTPAGRCCAGRATNGNRPWAWWIGPCRRWNRRSSQAGRRISWSAFRTKSNPVCPGRN
ncbi:MAG: sulfatase-like hydrolase/transferase [Bdellovibrionaceae bacterium]|nr:sulfatase-like hydrolase/transferase [Pseudobdellovibrionaceae bacterium]